MGLRKITLNSFLPICFKPKKHTPISHPSSQYSLKRLSLSGLSKQSSSSVMSDLSNSCIASNLRIFTLKELKAITKNFSKNNFLGKGGFGPVYKGFIDDEIGSGSLKEKHVAVKVLDLDGSQGHREWLAEVIFLGQLRHCHLVKLIGYCCEDKHRLLVYEYISGGNLENQLFKGYSTILPWLTRIKVAVGAAKGLAFLHEEEKPVIYRDFKASNILLDSDHNAKLSDFGLATDGPEGDETHITTRIMGTEGYAAPEYIMTGHLTTKSDVYSFGVVLLELLTGRRSVDKTRPCTEQDLVKWARPFLKDTLKLERVIDPRLEGQFSVEGATKVAALAYQCLSHHPKSRPSMNTVVKILEQVMELNDVQTGFFVYVVSIHGRAENENNEDQIVKNVEEKSQSKRSRKKIKPSNDRVAVHSDTALYSTLGRSFYSPKQTPV